MAEETRQLWRIVDRTRDHEIPATVEGLPATTTGLAEGAGAFSN